MGQDRFLPFKHLIQITGSQAIKELDGSQKKKSLALNPALRPEPVSEP